MNYFSIFFKNLTNHELTFCAFARKRQFIGNFEKISKFWKNFLKKIAKNALF